MATIKQKLVASKMVENGGNLGKSMRQAGYSPSVAKNPQKLTHSKGWAELMNDLFPEELLAKRHKDLLNARRAVVLQIKGKNVVKSVIDTAAVAKALDMAYKLKNLYPPQKQIVENSNDKYKDMTDEELTDIILSNPQSRLEFERKLAEISKSNLNSAPEHA